METNEVTIRYSEWLDYEVTDAIVFATYVYKGYIDLWDEINDEAGFLPDYIEKITVCNFEATPVSESYQMVKADLKIKIGVNHEE